MSEPRSDAMEQARAGGRVPWEKPSVTLLGNLRDLVHGGGKTGPNSDSDPQNTRKSGLG
jgi:hypothetical protein